jgi:predicted ATPase
MSNAIINIRNFGPIKKGEIELKPLTIFLGHNNTGKTYVALLIYSLIQALSGNIPGTIPSLNDIAFKSDSKTQAKIFKDCSEIRKISGTAGNVPYSVLPKSTQKIISNDIEESLKQLPKAIQISLHNYFQYSQPNELICRKLAHPRSMQIQITSKGGEPYLSLQVAPKSKKIRITTLTSPTIGEMNSKLLSADNRSRLSTLFSYAYFINSAFKSLFDGLDFRRPLYLPAARSGTMQVWPLMGTAITETMTRAVGLYPIKIGAVSGVTSDFMTTIFKLISFTDEPDSKNMKDPTKFMENELIGGKVKMARVGDLRTPTFFYSTSNLELDIQRSSSMVAELAPLDFLIKKYIEPGDLIIIDEPEAHLHPEKQRQIAELVALLIRSGVKVICTTHSHIFLHQISNLVLASYVSKEKRNQLNLEETSLSDSEVGVYLFDELDSGVNIRNIPIVKGCGYAEDDYIQVYKKLLHDNEALTN